MNKTSIEWVKNPDSTQGYTWNPITGCLNHTGGLCKGGGFPCYAYKLANERLKSRYLDNDNLAVKLIDPRVNPAKSLKSALDIKKASQDPFYPRFWEERIRELDPTWKSKHFTVGGASKVQPKGIFVCDMGELFGGWIPREWQEEIFWVIEENHQHRFYLLTKQPQNLIKFSPFPDHCWVGVTATNFEMFTYAMHYLSQVKAQMRFISLEPLLDWQPPGLNIVLRNVDWVIIGAQTKPYKPPAKIWIDEITEACKLANIPYFLKDNLHPLLGDNLVQDIPKGAEIDH